MASGQLPPGLKSTKGDERDLSGTKEKKKYLNLQERADQGEYELIEPLDYLILEILPDEGELVMGYYPFAKSSSHLVKERFKEMQPAQIAQDVRRLTRQRLAIQVKVRSSEHGWQRTKKGKEVFEEWKQRQKSSNSKPTEGKK